MQVQRLTADSDKARYNQGPISIGGVGGSGTRVVAEIAKALDIYMGATINRANDHLGFVESLKLFQVQDRETRLSKINQQLQLFEETMHTEYLTQVNSVVNWGWKVPGQFHLLRYTANYFPKMKYIHVIRHGLDMAFSKNRNQLRNWGPLLGVEANSPEDPTAALEYWIKANNLAISEGKSLLGDRFFLLNFDDLCNTPNPAITALATFITDNTSISSDKISDLCNLVVRPASLNRYQSYDYNSLFTTQAINSVRKLGYTV